MFAADKKNDGEGNAADLLSSGYDHAVVKMKRIAEDRFTVVDLARGYLRCSIHEKEEDIKRPGRMRVVTKETYWREEERRILRVTPLQFLDG